MTTYRYFLAPDISKLKKLIQTDKTKAFAHLKELYLDEYNDETLKEMVIKSDCQLWEYFETEQVTSMQINFLIKVNIILDISKKEINYQLLEFNVFSPWDSIKNAINQVTEFMDKYPKLVEYMIDEPTETNINFQVKKDVEVKWEIESITRLAHLN